ncbi:MAG: hypothetical protein ACTHZ1_04205 [Sphingobacterium sp.]
MVSKNILVDSALIGTVHFYAYVFNTKDGVIGFGLFPDDGPRPIFYVLHEKGAKTTLRFDEELIHRICEQSRFSTQERRMLFKNFLEYSSSLEHKIAKLIFKDLKMAHLADSREVVRYKRLYVHYNKDKTRDRATDKVHS